MVNFLVVQRRGYFALLRTQGVDRRRILGSVLWEAVALGAIGAIVVVAGIALAEVITDAVTATINDLYTRVVVRDIRINYSILAQLWLLAVAVAVLATVPCLWEVMQATAARGRQRSALEQQVQRGSRWLLLAVLPVLAVSTLVLLNFRGMIAGWLGTVLLIIAFLCTVPWVLFASMRVLRNVTRVVGRGSGSNAQMLGSMAVVVSRYGSRTGLATAALMLALAGSWG